MTLLLNQAHVFSTCKFFSSACMKKLWWMYSDKIWIFEGVWNERWKNNGLWVTQMGYDFYFILGLSRLTYPWTVSCLEYGYAWIMLSCLRNLYLARLACCPIFVVAAQHTRQYCLFTITYQNNDWLDNCFNFPWFFFSN